MRSSVLTINSDVQKQCILFYGKGTGYCSWDIEICFETVHLNSLCTVSNRVSEKRPEWVSLKETFCQFGSYWPFKVSLFCHRVPANAQQLYGAGQSCTLQGGSAVFPSRLSKDGFARLDAHLRKNARITPVFL